MKTVTILLTLLITSTSFSQPDSLWSCTFGGNRWEEGLDVQQTADGGYIITGTTTTFGVNDFDVWLVRADADGDSLWSRTFGGAEWDEGYKVLELADGGFMIAGWTSSFGAGDIDSWLIRTDSDGDSLWSRTFGGDLGDWCWDMCETDDGGLALAGFAGSFGAGSIDFWLVKVDADGDSLWSHTYGGEEQDWGRSIQETSDGGFVITGWTSSFGAGNNDIWLVRADADGDSLWSRTYGGERQDQGYSVLETSDGGFAVVGTTTSFGEGDYDIWLVRTDADGDSLWSRTYGGRGRDLALSAIEAIDGGFVITGRTRSFGAGDGDIWLIKTDADGNLLWTKTFGGAQDDKGFSVRSTSDGGFVVTGFTESFGAGDRDMWLIKTGMDNIRWLPFADSSFAENDSLVIGLSYFYDYIYPSVGIDTLLAFDVVDGERIFGDITDDTMTINAELDWFGRDSLMLIVSEILDEHNRDTTYLHVSVTPMSVDRLVRNPAILTLLPTHPNPFNSTTTINYTLPQSQQVSISIYDTAGRQIEMLYNGIQKAGNNSFVWDSHGVVSGVYLLYIEIDGNCRVAKLVVVK